MALRGMNLEEKISFTIPFLASLRLVHFLGSSCPNL